MKNIILIAPPAAGKGTQSEFLKERYNLNHISAGELLREFASNDTELGKKVSEIMKNGELVDDNMMIEIIKSKIELLNNSKGIIFDGYPRNIKQAGMLDELLESLNQSINYVIYLNIDKERAMKRTLGRLICPKCGHIYNKYTDYFEKEGFCNKCHVKLNKREDDNEESFIKRFNTFIESTKPLIDYYREKGLLYTIECTNDREETFEKIEKVINKE